MITETEPDDTFRLGQFYVELFTRRGVIIYVREHILEKDKLPQDIEGMFIELNFSKVKMVAFWNLPSAF